MKLVGIAIILLLAACGGSKSNVYQELSKLPACSSWDGQKISELTWGDGCLLKPGEVVDSAERKCRDGRALFWNDWGWGYAGDVAHAHARPDGQLVPPDAVDAACKKAS
jgi:hypothetical protein